jgi:hypothetical protein
LAASGGLLAAAGFGDAAAAAPRSPRSGDNLPAGSCVPYPIGVAIVETNAQALLEVSRCLERMRSVAIQIAFEPMTERIHVPLDNEYQDLKAEIDHLSGDTEVVGIHLLDGSTTSLCLLLPAPSRRWIVLDLQDCSTSTLGISTSDVSTKTGAASALPELDHALDEVNGSLREVVGIERVYTHLAD